MRISGTFTIPIFSMKNLWVLAIFSRTTLSFIPIKGKLWQGSRVFMVTALNFGHGGGFVVGSLVGYIFLLATIICVY